MNKKTVWRGRFLSLFVFVLASLALLLFTARPAHAQDIVLTCNGFVGTDTGMFTQNGVSYDNIRPTQENCSRGTNTVICVFTRNDSATWVCGSSLDEAKKAAQSPNYVSSTVYRNCRMNNNELSHMTCPQSSIKKSSLEDEQQVIGEEVVPEEYALFSDGEFDDCSTLIGFLGTDGCES